MRIWVPLKQGPVQPDCLGVGNAGFLVELATREMNSIVVEQSGKLGARRVWLTSIDIPADEKCFLIRIASLVGGGRCL